MKNFLKENWFKIGLIAILVISIAGAFYWFEWRPTQIRKECNIKASQETSAAEEKLQGTEGISLYNFSYNLCIRMKGL